MVVSISVSQALIPGRNIQDFFETDSEATANILSSKGEVTSQTFTTATNDNFVSKIECKAILKMAVRGYHFNEIKGTRSDTPLT